MLHVDYLNLSFPHDSNTNKSTSTHSDSETQHVETVTESNLDAKARTIDALKAAERRKPEAMASLQEKLSRFSTALNGSESVAISALLSAIPDISPSATEEQKNDDDEVFLKPQQSHIGKPDEEVFLKPQQA